MQQKKYNDILFFLVLIPGINALNYYLTYSKISFSWHTLFTFLIDTAQGYIAWLLVRSIILYLDRKVPYSIQPLKRIYLQLLLTTVAGLLTIIILTELLNLVARDAPVPVSFYKYDIFIFLIWFLVINGIYVGLHYYSEWKNAETKRLDEKKIRLEGLIVKQGKENISLAFEDIIGFYVDGDYTTVITSQQKKYLLSQSLDKIEQTLPSEWFFRLNRQFIVHRQGINGFKRAENNKLDVILNDSSHFPSLVQVSRTKAPTFKSWFQPDQDSESTML